MNQVQKRAWAIVISMSLAMVLGAAALVMHLLEFGSLRVLIFAAAAVLVAGVLVSFRFKPARDAVTFDERDRQIEKNANLAGFGAVYAFIILASFAPIAILGEGASIQVTWLPCLLVGAGLCQGYAFFVAVLVQYGRGGDDHE